MANDLQQLRWERDRAGDSLWHDTTFLGCIYNRDGLASSGRVHGWRALAGEEMIPVGDALPAPEQPDPRLGARDLLEAHVGYQLPLPTAERLLGMTS